ncbi:MAG: thiamine-phosphate kinase [Elusimicrobia bacterium]|nr:thiamine-phosphate kinase [Elusimicrobiota bacterium]
MGEWGLLARFLPRLSKGLSGRVNVKPGDDAAVVSLGPRGPQWAITTDMLVEGVHFDSRWTSGEDLGHKALAVNLSDLAAMGDVIPRFGVVSLGITPKIPVNYVDRLYKGFEKLAKYHKFDIVGGDTVRSDRIVVSVTAIGQIRRRNRVILRSGARFGDILMVTGTLGDAAAGLAILTGQVTAEPPKAAAFLERRLLRPEPRLDLAKRIARPGALTSLIDSSDGLWRSVRILCAASNVGARIQAESLPVSPALKHWAKDAGKDPIDYALTGGEDYELIMTARPAWARVLESRGLAKAVGRIVPSGEGVKVLDDEKERRIPVGFEHFS